MKRKTEAINGPPYRQHMIHQPRIMQQKSQLQISKQKQVLSSHFPLRHTRTLYVFQSSYLLFLCGNITENLIDNPTF